MGRKWTEKDIKLFLSSIQEFSQRNHERLVQIMELRAVAESCTARMDKENIQTSGDGDKLANIVGKIVDLEREICRVEHIIEHRKAKFEEITNNFSDSRQREFLTIRYVEGNGFYDMAMLMDLKDSTAKRIHRNAIAEFTKIYNAKHNI